MRTFDEAMELCTIVPTAAESAFEVMLSRIAAFDSEARESQLVMMLIQSCVYHAITTAIMEDEDRLDVELKSLFYSVLLHGVAVGREMERMDLEKIIT